MDQQIKHSKESAHKHSDSNARTFGAKCYDFYLNHYKILVIIPFIVLLLSLTQIGLQYATTGDIVSKGIALKGGVSMTVERVDSFTSLSLQDKLAQEFAGHEVNVRELASLGKVNGFIIESDLATDEGRDKLISTVESLFPGLNSNEYSVEVTGPSIGEQLFKQAKNGLIIAFICMGLVVWFSYKTPFPVFGIILAAASNMIITLAIFNLSGERLSAAGVAAFLMVLGYSVDTDILLASRLLKRADSPFKSRLLSAIKTSFLMTATTAAAVAAALIFTNSDTIRQIMFILAIGLVVDVFITYMQNANLLRIYLEKKGEVTLK